MINPNGDEFTKNDPLSGSTTPSEPHISPSGAPRFQTTAGDNISTGGTSNTWQQTREKANIARQRTEFFLRENPIPTILGALGIGIAIGLAIRFASEDDEPVVEATKPLKTS